MPEVRRDEYARVRSERQVTQRADDGEEEKDDNEGARERGREALGVVHLGAYTGEAGMTLGVYVQKK